MKLRVIPRSENFYDLFVRAAANVADGAGLLLKLLTDYHDPEAAHAEIRQRENEGDRIYRKTVARLFSGEYKAMDVLKWKDLVDQLEAAIDKCEDVANTLESIVLKHA